MVSKYDKNIRLTSYDFRSMGTHEIQEEWINYQLEVAEHANDAASAEISVMNIEMAAKSCTEEDQDFNFAADILIELIELEIDETKVSTYNKAAKYALKANDHKKALKVTDKGLGKWPKSKTILAQHIIALGRYGTDGAIKQRDAHIQKALNLTLGKDDVELIKALAEYFCNKQNPKKALKLIQPVLEKIASGKTDFEHSHTLAMIRLALSQDTNLKKALRSSTQDKANRAARIMATDVFTLEI